MFEKPNALVTGANGFVGRFLLNRLRTSDNFNASGSVRAANKSTTNNLTAIGAIHGKTDWSSALNGKQLVVHTAARAHIMQDNAVDPLSEFRKINVDGTESLARQSAAAGVRRFVFISSIKVNGEQTNPGKPFTASDLVATDDPYGISKLEAEQKLWAIGRETGMEIVVIRPTLVYGPGVKGNFASLIRLVQKGLPLPFGAISNKRSLVGLDNLVDLIIACLDHPAAANQVFLVSDGRDLSTTELLRTLAEADGKRARLIPVPEGLLEFSAALLGKRAMARRLLGSLQVDISKNRELLGWTPPFSVEEGLKRCFTGYQDK
ncbi:UDP-glucose 4-epimerase family protein [Marinobacter fonticola]|uniref:UDP-glucose 4-epimerase family protein n=1 Tax=Marinobacter fonticola TaxID=2603215 RepID=UPI0011E6FB6E|nr:SDR family oxidoreductase [Marinobacter fonticola]